MLRFLSAALALSLFGCISDPTLEMEKKPPPPPPPPPTSTPNLTGTVTTNGSPVAGATVYIHQPGQAVKTATTDTSGRYSTRVSGYYSLQVNKAGFAQPCVADGSVASTSVGTENVELYSESALSAGATPPASNSALIVGTVSMGGTPVRGATVMVVDYDDMPLAFTKTDSQGRYFVCRVPNNELLIAFGDAGYSDYYDVGVATNRTVDLTLQ